VYFDFDKYSVKDQYKSMVLSHARYLRENSNASVRLEGNADERGSREYNLALGQRRADSVKKVMTLSGTKESQIESVSYGEEKPRAMGHNEAAWAENRRADIRYQGE
jgi:peptidoglycan-associated lipoprotein